MNKDLDEAYYKTFTSDYGKIVLNDLIKITKVFDTTYAANAPNLSAFLEGQRRVTLNILQRMRNKNLKIDDTIVNRFVQGEQDE